MYRESGISPFRVLEPYVLSNPVSVFVQEVTWKTPQDCLNGNLESSVTVHLDAAIPKPSQ